jgi:hypothetical protein
MRVEFYPDGQLKKVEGTSEDVEQIIAQAVGKKTKRLPRSPAKKPKGRS